MADIPRLSNKEYLILDMLRNGREMFGLEMVKKSSGALVRGTVYVTLSRMTDKGYLVSRQEKSPRDPGMPRRLYRITGLGLNSLNAIEVAKSHFSGGEYA